MNKKQKLLEISEKAAMWWVNSNEKVDDALEFGIVIINKDILNRHEKLKDNFKNILARLIYVEIERKGQCVIDYDNGYCHLLDKASKLSEYCLMGMPVKTIMYITERQIAVEDSNCENKLVANY